MLGVPVVLPATLCIIFSHAPLLPPPPPPPSGAGLIAGIPEYIAKESVRVLKQHPSLHSSTLPQCHWDHSQQLHPQPQIQALLPVIKKAKINMLTYIRRILYKLTERWWVEWNCLIIYGTGKFSSNIVSYMYLFFFLFLLFLLLFNFFFIQNIFKSTARNVVNISILSTNKQIKFGSVWECFPKVRTDRLDQLFWKINEILVFSQIFY